MTNLDPTLREALNRIYPAPERESDWEDVLARTGRKLGPEVRARRSIAFRRARILALAAVAIGATSLTVLLWPAGTPLTERALAALGDARVLHVITHRPAPSERLVEIASGRIVIPTQEAEIWFDEKGQRARIVTRVDGGVREELLQTRQGWFTRGGLVYTCAWIASHPAEATKAGVSCNENMQNSTSPRSEPELPPTVDASLTAFARGYQNALESGEAQPLGEGSIDGQRVEWLEFRGADGSSQRVALDRGTLRPLRVETSRPNQQGSVARYDIALIETVPSSKADFSLPPRRTPQQSIGKIADEQSIDLARAADVLGQAPLWLGPQTNGLHLSRIEAQRLVTGYGPGADLPSSSTHGIELVYGNISGGPHIRLREATRCELAYAWPCSMPAPREGYLRIDNLPGSGGALVRDGLYVRIVSSLGEKSIINAARALRPAP
jgi:hypothetical protein